MELKIYEIQKSMKFKNVQNQKKISPSIYEIQKSWNQKKLFYKKSMSFKNL